MSSVCAAAPPATNSGVHGASPSSSPSTAELCPVLSLTHTYVCINPSVTTLSVCLSLRSDVGLDPCDQHRHHGLPHHQFGEHPTRQEVSGVMKLVDMVSVSTDCRHESHRCNSCRSVDLRH